MPRLAGGSPPAREQAEEEFRARVVATILDSRTEEALRLLSEHYRVEALGLGVGVFEGRTKGVAAAYSPRKKQILAAKREFFYDPFVIVHEFYHHLRSVSGKHRGTEKQADRFALEFVDAYNRARGIRAMGWNTTGGSGKKGRDG